MYHGHKAIYIAAAVAMLLCSCVSLRKYTELSQDKERSDSINKVRIEALEGRLRQTVSSQLALLQDTLRLSLRLDSMRQCYERLLRGTDSERAVAASRLRDSRSRLSERLRREQKSDSLDVLLKRLAEAEERLREKERLTEEYAALLSEARKREDFALRMLGRYDTAAMRLRTALLTNDTTGRGEAIAAMSLLRDEEIKPFEP